MIRVNLALQGGGAHGAFSWGVLDRICEDDGIEVAALSGTSAGALNAAAFKAGLIAGGRQGARDALRRLWDAVANAGDLAMSPWLQAWAPWAPLAAQAMADMMPLSAPGIAAQFVSPYALGGFWRNPLAPMVAELDFSHVCAGRGPQLFISATNVRTGRIRVFSGAEITPDVLLASTCLPTIFQTVEIADPATGVTDGYWDGGYTGNPALFPLYDPGLPDDIVIVSINPMRREEIPMTPAEIGERVNEISFNASLLADLRAVAFVKRLIAEGRMPRGQMKDVLVHMISDEPLMSSLPAANKLRVSATGLERMFVAGRAAADRFLSDHRTDLGHRGTVDLGAMLR